MDKKNIIWYCITLIIFYSILVFFCCSCTSQKAKCQKAYNYLLDNCPELVEVKKDTVTKTIPGVNIHDTSLVQVPYDEIIKNKAKGDTLPQGKKKTLIEGKKDGIKYKTDVDLNTGKVSTEIEKEMQVVTVTSNCICITDNSDVWEWFKAKVFKYKWGLLVLFVLSIALFIAGRKL